MRKKKNLLNKNSMPFLILVLIHMVMLLILLKRKKQKETWILFLSNVGWAYLFEYITVNLFHGYRYKPSLMKKQEFDSILGAILSQGLYVPVSATFLTLYKKNWKWKIVVSVVYFFTELIFLRLKVYKTYWWKPIYTPILLNVYFYLSDGVYKALSSQKRWALSIAHYLSIEVIWISIMFIYANVRQIRFGRGHFHTWKEHFVIVPLYSFFLTFIATITSAKSSWAYRALLLFSHLLLDMALIRTGLLKIKFKPLYVSVLRYTFMVVLSRVLYKYIYKDNG